MAATVSLPPSRPPSIRAQAPTPLSHTPPPHTPPPPKAAPNAVLPQVNSSKFKSRLRNMFETPSTATFSVNVTIHELGNVPQLDGKFAVRWKFRGHRPHDADRMLQNPVLRRNPSLISDSKSVKSVKKSSSMLSMRTASSASVSTTTSASPTRGKNRTPVPHAKVPHHSASLPPPSHSTLQLPREPQKKATDPTPLRQSTKPVDVDPTRRVVEEPGGMAAAGSFGGVDTDATLRGPRGGRSATMETSTTETSTSTEASDPTPRPEPSVRSGKICHGLGPRSNAPSIVSTLDSTRAPSRASTRSDQSIPSVLISGHGRSATYPGPGIEPDFDSDERKGRTPIRAIRAHSVAWEYKLHTVLRIPLGKHVEVAQTSRKGTVTPKATLPILGGGPLSDSSLKLDIERVDERGEGQKTGSGQDVLFGYVNIDLAPFADLGPVTRKFLLKYSKTNATIRVTIDVRYIGGEQAWVAPPMAEGHLVQGLSELTGDEPQLRPTASISSGSDNSAASARPFGHSALHVNAVQANLAAVATAKHQYRSYEHHLRPETTKREASQRKSMSQDSYSRSTASSNGQKQAVSPAAGQSQASWSPGASSFGNSPPTSNPEGVLTCSPESTPNLFHKSLSLSPGYTPVLLQVTPASHNSTFNSGLSPIASPTEFGAPLSSVVSNGSAPFPHLAPITSNLDIDTPCDSLGNRYSAMSPDMMSASFQRRHSQFTHSTETQDMPPDMIIEALFNPRPADENSPFTYIPSIEEEVEPEYEEMTDEDFTPQPEGQMRRDATMPATGQPHSHWKRIIRRRHVSSPLHRS